MYDFHCTSNDVLHSSVSDSYSPAIIQIFAKLSRSRCALSLFPSSTRCCRYNERANQLLHHLLLSSESNANVRLQRLTAVAAAKNLTANPRLCTAHIFNLVVQEYQVRDPDGMDELTMDGLRRTLTILSTSPM